MPLTVWLKTWLQTAVRERPRQLVVGATFGFPSFMSRPLRGRMAPPMRSLVPSYGHPSTTCNRVICCSCTRASSLVAPLPSS